MPPSRREAVRLAAAVPCRSSGVVRRNISFGCAVAGQLSPQLGCDGARAVQTLNLDRLAHEGGRFSDAFVSAAVCSATRSAIAVDVFVTQ